jgi:hypothetical protein
VFGPYIPILLPFVDLWVTGGVTTVPQTNGWKYPAGFVSTLLRVLRPNVPYITVSQNDEGLVGHDEFKMSQIPNVLVLSAGGYGHVPVPLLKQAEVPLESLEDPDQRAYLVSYVGTMRHGPKKFRAGVQQAAVGAANKLKAKTAGWATRPDWKEIMAQSKASLAPRGFGRTAYHVMEVLQMGLVPIYVYSDVPWVPYEDLFRTVGYVSSVRDLGRVMATVKSLSSEEWLAREKRARDLVPTHFSFEGAMSQIGKFMLDPTTSDLRCRPLPRMKNRRRAR